MDATSATLQGVALRGLCSGYFETHVSPVLKYVSQSQEHINVQLEDIRKALSSKASVAEVLTREEFQRFKASNLLEDSKGVSTLARLQDLTATLKGKADAKAVPTREQLSQLDSSVQRKLSQFSSTLELRVANLATAVEQLQASPAFAAKEVCAESGGLAGSSEAAKAALQAQESYTEEMKRIKVLVAAAGSRFDKQLREVRAQIKELREELRADPQAAPVASGRGEAPGEADELTTPRGLPLATPLGERWPGRSLSDLGRPESEVGSDIGSQAPSFAPSYTGLSPDELQELKKVQAVVGAAGTAFTKELKDIRRQMGEQKERLGRLESLVTLQKVTLSVSGSFESGRFFAGHNVEFVMEDVTVVARFCSYTWGKMRGATVMVSTCGANFANVRRKFAIRQSERAHFPSARAATALSESTRVSFTRGLRVIAPLRISGAASANAAAAAQPRAGAGAAAHGGRRSGRGRLARLALAAAAGLALWRRLPPWVPPAPGSAEGGAAEAHGAEARRRLAGVFGATLAAAALDDALPPGALAVAALSAAVASDALPLERAASGFGSEVPWLVLASFFLARAFESTGLSQRVGLHFLRAFGGSAPDLAYGLCLAEVGLGLLLPSSAARSVGILLPLAAAVEHEASAAGAGGEGGELRAFLALAAFHATAHGASLWITGACLNFMALGVARDLGAETARGDFVEWWPSARNAGAQLARANSRPAREGHREAGGAAAAVPGGVDLDGHPRSGRRHVV
ncbi:unnamed protein product, partial [Prorocentrum cordatum]